MITQKLWISPVDTDLEKRCSECLLELPLKHFHKHKNNKDGYRNVCKTCRNIYQSLNYYKTRGKVVRERGLRRNLNGFGLDPLKIKVMQTKRNHKRKAIQTNSIPAWYNDFDDFVLSEATELCKIRKDATGVRWSIDHIVPLQNKNACGLHWHKNLHVVPHSWNCKKKNLHTEPYWN